MKLLIVTLSMLLASSFAFAAKKHVKVTEETDSAYTSSDDDSAPASTSSTKLRHRRASSDNSVLRTITPVIGLVVSDTNLSQTSSKTGFFFGGAVDLLKLGDLTFETGLQYKQQGATVTNGGAIIHMNYLVVPLAAKYFFMGERASGIYGKAGFMPGINVSHSVSDSSGNNSQDIPGANTFDLGIMAGVGGKLAIERNLAIVLETNYVRGLTNSFDSTSSGGLSIVNSSFTFLTGVAFAL